MRRELMSSTRILKGSSPLDIAPAPPSKSVTTLPSLFHFQAHVHSQKTAFSCDEEQLTYAEADADAQSIASQLPSNNKDATPAVVAIWLEKGLDLLLAILGTTYSGATWLPFDPDVPVDRAAVCIADAAATVLLCDDAHIARAQEVAASLEAPPEILHIRTLRCNNHRGDQLAPRARPEDAAYIIYTSGTTGTPKGIAIPHSAALTFALSERTVLETTVNDVVWNGESFPTVESACDLSRCLLSCCACTGFSPAFDMFVEEMWVTIAGAGHLAIGTRSECRDVAGLPGIWKSRGVTIVNAVPTLIGIMGIAGGEGDALLPPCVRLINLGGEACPPALVDRLARPGLRIINTYGPTETTVTATWDELHPHQPVTIGRPLPSYHACLLPVPGKGEPLELAEGVEGELAIGGPCVGLGYVGRPVLTSQKFIPHPLIPGSRLYRTGDRVRLTADLKIAFLGRIDTQVKHRGFRIELGEIESLMCSHPDIQTAAVILAHPNTDEARLEAFVVSPVRNIDVKDLCSQRLPAYMRPELVWQLEADEIPRLPSGKINGKALHELSEHLAAAAAQHHDESEAHESSYDRHSPLAALITTLATVFPSAGRIDPAADFFDDLGGHSLLAAVLVSRLRSHPMYTAIALPDIYEARTVQAIAARFSPSESATATTYLDYPEGTGPTTGEHLPVSRTKFVLCGAAQAVSLLFFFFILSLEILVPYLLFDFLLLSRGVAWAILGAYGTFVCLPPAMALVAITGKWLALGRAQAGEYPLYGTYYFRWWLAERFANLVNPKLLADSPLYPSFLRAMGSSVGHGTHLGALVVGAACDLVDIGDDTVIGADVVLGVSVVERGRLILKPVKIGNDVTVGSNCVIEGGSTLGEGAQLAALSMLPDGMTVPSFQRYHGSPARFEEDVKDAVSGQASRPSRVRFLAVLASNALVVAFVLPLLYFVPQIPGLLLFDLLDLRSVGAWGQVAILSIPIAFAYQLLVFAQLIFYRWLLLGRLREGTYGIYTAWYLRKWFVERIMDLALDVLHPVFATLYIVPFLRALGVKIGKRAEISTARGLQFQLLEVGDESFVADAVLMGDVTVRHNQVTLQKTVLEKRSFAGNASLIPQGTVLPTGSLVGVLSIAPAKTPLAPQSSCFGSPPMLMPAREKIEASNNDDSLLYNPPASLVATRLLIEGLRIVVPRAVVIFGLGFALQIILEGYSDIGAVPTLLMLPLFYFGLFALPAMLFTIALKWLIVGDYTKRPSHWPLWSLNVWTSEAVTSTWETIAEPLLASLLVGTPFLAWCFRALGVKIGARVTLLSSDITEYDLVELDDESTINQHSGPQTHLFQDRVMQLGAVKLGKRAVMKPYSICLPGSSIAAGAQLGSLSLLMKGESLPEDTAWEGAPCKPRASRQVATLSEKSLGSSSSTTLHKFPHTITPKSLRSISY